MPKLILLRHGQSVWNANNLFTGWVDVPLSPTGIEEAINAGKKIADIPIDLIFTSTLMRAQQTAMLAMSVHHGEKTAIVIHEEKQQQEWSAIYSEKTEQNCIPVYIDSRLNERYYGELQGQNKQEVRERFGAEQVHIWRRSYDIAPPNGESLKMTAERTIPCFKESILPALETNQHVFVAAHGNSLRSIVMEIEQLTKEQVLQLEIATGDPMIYEFDNGTLSRTY